MSDTRVSVLTPPGTGAIATVAVVGPQAWELVRAKFRPAKGTLPDSPPLHRFWYGNLGEGVGDEVIIAVRHVDPEVWIKVHCHGGRRVVQWLVEQFGVPSRPPTFPPGEKGTDPRALEPLTRATTTRTASILLDQYHGAYIRAIESIRANWPNSREQLARLVALAPLGRHLVEPWKVVIAGPPNVGKSSLINALAGYQRSIVAPIAGTTRDVVTVRVAFDGWPVELSDTAGLRDATESLEAAGIARARAQLASADLIVWVVDLSEPAPVPPDLTPHLIVGNKSDLAPVPPGLLPVSAVTGTGIADLIAAVVAQLVPISPEPGEAVPYTPELANQVEQALARGQPPTGA